MFVAEVRARGLDARQCFFPRISLGWLVTVTTVPLATPLTANSVRSAAHWPWRALVTLTKPQLAFMSVLTAMVAYATARPTGGPAMAVLTLVGTSLAAAGALSLNQWW